jgi:hypothetical protein
VKYRRYGRKKYRVKGQKLLQPDERHFVKLGFNELEKQLFHEEFFFNQWTKKYVKHYVFNEPWRFVLRVRPNMITKVRKRDNVIESRLQEINNYLERNNYTGRMWKVAHGGGYNYYWKAREFYKDYTFFPTSLKVIINQYLEE